MPASKGKVVLLSNEAVTSEWKQWPGGVGLFSAEATWGGGSVSLEYKLPNGTAVAAGANTTLTANGGGLFELPPCQIRAAVVVATAAYATAAHRGE